MNLRLVVLQSGRVRDPACIGLRDEYVKRLRRFARLEVVEARVPRWPEGLRRVLCDAAGAAYTSEAFASHLGALTERHGGVALALGDADGFPTAFASQAQEQLSLSAMVLPHQLAHVVLLEQCYRAATILAGHPYHHGG